MMPDTMHTSKNGMRHKTEDGSTPTDDLAGLDLKNKPKHCFALNMCSLFFLGALDQEDAGWPMLMSFSGLPIHLHAC